ncbi:polymorphic toxin-type HINT domain-containing protein [Paenibacillus paridis]|uniref:polymorphic toxin-type HINT domain-containing protein n=1 Tax=Paenibacillus paridis TaxID=2583376 RepID=UPI001EE3D63D|nr:polymorphic toxin-type HINT domain-containing protein [Paenibacillus paridis]
MEATAEHSFWLDSKGWTFVKDLKVGDLLVSSDGTKLAIVKIEKEPREATVYNFEVADFHSYFVSNLGVWVHNCAVKGAGNSVWQPTAKNADLWNKGKLKAHFDKHGSTEFGAKSSKEYSDMAYEFGTRISDSIVQTTTNGYVNRYEPSTQSIFVGTENGGRIKFFYKWDGRPDDMVIQTLKEQGLIR